MVVILVMITGGVTLNVLEYQTNQEYSQVASDQLDPDHENEAYLTMHTQKGVNEMFVWLYYLGILISIFIFYKIWFTKIKKIEK